ncbi:MAG: hypothetical protein ABL951_02670 [Alphaproteobacteria bacterium]
MLHIFGSAGIDLAMEEYGIDDHGLRMNWSAMANRYDGVIIAPYCHEKRCSLSAVWYYGWDCASGRIWNADAIERVESCA